MEKSHLNWVLYFSYAPICQQASLLSQKKNEGHHGQTYLGDIISDGKHTQK